MELVRVHLSTSISGPKGRGDVAVSVTKSEGGNWQVFSMDIRVDRKLALVWWASQHEKGFYVLPPRIPTSEEPIPPPTPTQAPPVP
jgi:hypothetical protein